MTTGKRAFLALLAATLPALPAAAQQAPPAELFGQVGTVITVQIRDFLSSNRNTPGDGFLAALQQPLVIDGWVVARPGQTVFGQVTSANSAGRVKGTSDMVLELTEITLVDGHQAPIRTQLVKNYGRPSKADDVGTIAGVTALGTLIGVAVGDGRGAAIGAGVGAAAATIGVLATRGKATEIYPESTVTFRLDAPLVVSTERSQQAFLSVAPDDYERVASARTPPRRYPEHLPPPPPPYGPVYDPYPRYPRSRVGAVIVVPSIIINSRRGRDVIGHRRRW